MSHKVAYGSVWVGLFLHLRHWDRQKNINSAAKELIYCYINWIKMSEIVVFFEHMQLRHQTRVM